MKRFFRFTTVVFSVLFLILTASSCAKASKETVYASQDYMMGTELSAFEKSSEEYNTAYYAESEVPLSDSEAGNTVSSMLSSDVESLNVKLIYSADLKVQTLNFKETYNTLCNLVNLYGGYFESFYENYGSMNSSIHPYGNCTIRIPSEKYTDFINQVGTSTHLVNIKQSVEDISLTYSNIEDRLETLKIKHERLLDLLSSAKEMKDIISLENAISECESEQNRYNTRKKIYDSLVGFSTINLDLTEVERLNPTVTENRLTFGQRLLNGIKSGFNRTVGFLSSLLLWILSNIFFILVICGLVIAVVKIVEIIKKHKKHEAGNNNHIKKKSVQKKEKTEN